MQLSNSQSCVLDIRTDNHALAQRSRLWRKRILNNTDIRLIDYGSATFEEEYHSTVVCTRHYRAPETILGTSSLFCCPWWSMPTINHRFRLVVSLRRFLSRMYPCEVLHHVSIVPNTWHFEAFGVDGSGDGQDAWAFCEKRRTDKAGVFQRRKQAGLAETQGVAAEARRVRKKWGQQDHWGWVSSSQFNIISIMPPAPPYPSICAVCWYTHYLCVQLENWK